MAELASTVHDNKGDLFASFNVDDFPVPHVKDEVWRYVPLRRLRGLHDGTFSTAVPAQVSVEIPAGADGVTYEKVARDDARIGRTGGGVDRVAAQAWTSSTEGHIVTFAKNSTTTEPVIITITGSGPDVTAFGNLVVEVEDGATASVQIHTVGTGTLADNHEYLVGDNARLSVVVHEDWDDDAVHLGAEVAELGRDAVLRHNVALFGGSVVRLQPRVKYLAPGGDAELLGVYFADDGQFFEQRMLVDHSQPNCRSNVLYKGALQGDKTTRTPDARTAWIGDVLIRANAQGTDTYEANRNLVLTEGARADAVPNLEIETGSIVGAGHAATVGRFDDEQLFYLLSRGIPEAEARKLIVHGFFSEVIARIPVEGLRETLEAKITEELEGLSFN
ncbi:MULTISPECIES: Fe-S cluster assembly protein SufD [Corynebacterium]|uniref:Fe-S cluster assembly protein SufD n=1 Tax=Corynebacterium glucuronolyticum TaxID=39791 RepID=A0A7T4JUE1_9CORY|nr:MULTISPECIES: Fe-S cluster assembly protein SufD [Corynebacterium]EEI26609.1 FeS assembly protein SufD [Corynebacterium glucuronolyticum ATCC 51867]MCT1442896.1 Fe-S cluster assembly protein SufD [Corynebacterium glucuronolyticum]MCT1562618.1 Fe-S cluster assembly protein SufD [Corynebacterium glucuronolyticum]OFO48280.1 Fe-S cluster assembly protein SufD [Corynebacterium sp. HMSC073D01]QQB45706.1 Fe-S cluster assembly protein SufD [Corynebacterium glucuronolyticum]